jgi:hypothetical protein
MTRTTPWLRSDRFSSYRTTTGSADGPTGTDIKRPVGWSYIRTPSRVRGAIVTRVPFSVSSVGAGGVLVFVLVHC